MTPEDYFKFLDDYWELFADGLAERERRRQPIIVDPAIQIL